MVNKDKVLCLKEYRFVRAHPQGFEAFNKINFNEVFNKNV